MNESQRCISRLMDMGLHPGELIRVRHEAPLGDPISIEFRTAISLFASKMPLTWKSDCIKGIKLNRIIMDKRLSTIALIGHNRNTGKNFLFQCVDWAK